MPHAIAARSRIESGSRAVAGMLVKAEEHIDEGLSAASSSLRFVVQKDMRVIGNSRAQAGLPLPCATPAWVEAAKA